MRVLVTGGTGVVGRRLLPLLVGAGHEVVALTRRHDKDEVVAKLGARPARGSLFDSASLEKAARGSDVFVHAATAIPSAARPKPADWETNDRIRTEGTRNLVELAKSNRTRRLVIVGVTWVAKQPDGSVFDEMSPLHADPATRSAVEMERIARESGLDVTALRLGWLYSADSVHVRSFGEMLQKRRMPIIGDGRARLSLLHADDAAQAIATALDEGARGMFHVVDNEPVSVRDYLGELARIVGAPTPRRVPAWLARLVVGRGAVEFMTHPAPTTAAAFKAATGWMPRYPTCREGLAQVDKAWKTEGFPGKA